MLIYDKPLFEAFFIGQGFTPDHRQVVITFVIDNADPLGLLLSSPSRNLR
jgi:hypothetical protein